MSAKYGFLLVVICFAVNVGHAQTAQPTPAASPIPTPQAMASPSPSTANPADVASIDSIIAAVYDVISGPAGKKRDWDRMR
ncbi:MAG: hypothetical protein AABN95_16990 [Acidobacteriota bacterium]